MVSLYRERWFTMHWGRRLEVGGVRGRSATTSLAGAAAPARLSTSADVGARAGGVRGDGRRGDDVPRNSTASTGKESSRFCTKGHWRSVGGLLLLSRDGVP